MTFDFIIYKLILVISVFAISLLIAMYSTYAERKLAAFFQDRIGPNRAGLFGLLQPVADGIKMFMKEEFIPSGASKFLFILGPSIAMLLSLMTAVVIPFGKDLNINGNNYPLQITDINIGVLYLLGVVSVAIYGILIGAWASNNKYSLLSALRASSQMISYEIAMGIAIISLCVVTGTLSLREIAEQQNAGFANFIYQPLGFFIFLICAFAETNRAPFDLAECESELIGGYHTEYSSMKLGFYLFAEYVNLFVSAAVISVLYFGAYSFPFSNELNGIISQNAIVLLGTLALFFKIFFFIFFFMWVRWTLPRLRYDQLMHLGWRILIPLSIFNLLMTSLFKYFL